MRVDLHRHLQVRMPGDRLYHLRRGAKFKQEAHDCVSQIMKPDSRQPGLFPDTFPVGVEASRLDWCADACGEDQIMVSPQLAGVVAHGGLLFVVFEQ